MRITKTHYPALCRSHDGSVFMTNELFATAERAQAALEEMFIELVESIPVEVPRDERTKTDLPKRFSKGAAT